ncbi:hypothetical protein Aglo01_48910 [Actinokineospora globicatena]|nr:hypothetical protein Aglo01_48910 [Actinokineospora globicatena]
MPGLVIAVVDEAQAGAAIEVAHGVSRFEAFDARGIKGCEHGWVLVDSGEASERDVTGRVRGSVKPPESTRESRTRSRFGKQFCNPANSAGGTGCST